MVPDTADVPPSPRPRPGDSAQMRRLVPNIRLSHGMPHPPPGIDVPEIDAIWTDIPDLHAPMGAHGIDEVGTTGTGAAVANTINATGRHTLRLRITPDGLIR